MDLSFAKKHFLTALAATLNWKTLSRQIQTRLFKDALPKLLQIRSYQVDMQKPLNTEHPGRLLIPMLHFPMGKMCKTNNWGWCLRAVKAEYSRVSVNHVAL